MMSFLVHLKTLLTSLLAVTVMHAAPAGATGDRFQSVVFNDHGKQAQALEIASQSHLDGGGMNHIDVHTNEPKVTFRKWNDEVALGVRYTGLPATTPASHAPNDITWHGAKQTMEAVPLDATTSMEDGGMEINVNLASKPASNVFTFQLNGWENLDFFFQPALTPEEITEGGRQPDNVVGSYAVYYKNHANHIEGQTNYATGKAYHIYRPKVTDTNGKTVWAELGYTDGVLTLTVPQSFLDGAAYPVVVDPTFGYTTKGGTSDSFPFNSANIAPSAVYTASSGDTITAFSVYQVDGTSPKTIQMAAYTVVGGLATTRLSTATNVTTTNNGGEWATTTASIAMTGGTQYAVAFGLTASNSNTIIWEDTVSSGRDADTASTNLPSTWVHNSTLNKSYSMYITYTAGAAAAITPTKVQINAKTIINGKTLIN